jgi:hypothetical protein
VSLSAPPAPHPAAFSEQSDRARTGARRRFRDPDVRGSGSAPDGRPPRWDLRRAISPPALRRPSLPLSRVWAARGSADPPTAAPCADTCSDRVQTTHPVPQEWLPRQAPHRGRGRRRTRDRSPGPPPVSARRSKYPLHPDRQSARRLPDPHRCRWWHLCWSGTSAGCRPALAANYCGPGHRFVPAKRLRKAARDDGRGGPPAPGRQKEAKSCAWRNGRAGTPGK